MRKFAIGVLVLALVFIIYLFWNSTIENTIREVISDQERNIESRNINSYMKNISTKTPEYIAEKESWFRDLMNNEITDYKLRVIKVKRTGIKKAIATVVQSYKYNGRYYKVKLDLTLIKERDGWKDSDLNFREMNTKNFTIKYFKQSYNQAKIIKSICEESKANVEHRYGSKIEDNTTIKIYENLEMLRQSVKLSFPWEFAGWYEYPESIKTSKYDSKENYQRILEHELMHKLTIKDSNNNLPYWLTEGIAVYFTNFYNDRHQIKSADEYIKTFNVKPLDILELESINLETLDNNTSISKYYDSAGLIVKYLVDAYGKEKIKGIVETLGTYPYQAGTGAEIDKLAQERFHNVIKNTLGIDVNQLNNNWNEYINKTVKVNFN